LTVSSGSRTDLFDFRRADSDTKQNRTGVESDLTKLESEDLSIDEDAILYNVVLDLSRRPDNVTLMNHVATNAGQRWGQGVTGFGSKHDSGENR
jgi:hypothetical protein